MNMQSNWFWRSRQPRRIIVILAAALAISVIGAVVLASVPDSEGKINGCYEKTTGILRIIDTETHSCTNLENPISWFPHGAPDVYEFGGDAVSLPDTGVVTDPVDRAEGALLADKSRPNQEGSEPLPVGQGRPFSYTGQAEIWNEGSNRAWIVCFASRFWVEPNDVVVIPFTGMHAPGSDPEGEHILRCQARHEEGGSQTNVVARNAYFLFTRVTPHFPIG